MKRRLLPLAIALLGLIILAPPASADFLIANVTNSSIVRYNEAANTLTTFVSSGSGGLVSPNGMTYGADGNLYVSSIGTGSVLEYNGSTGAFLGTLVAHTVGGQTLQYPNGIAFDPNSTGRYLYISSFFDNAIERYDTIAHTLSIYAMLPSNALTAGHLQGPTGLVFGADGNLYVNFSTQFGGNQVREYVVSTNDTVGRSIISGVSDSITHLNAPAQLAFAPSSTGGLPTLIDTSFFNNSVNTYRLTFVKGQLIATYANSLAAVSPSVLNQPGGVAFDSSTGRVLITNYLGNTLVSANINGASDVNVFNPISIGGAVLDGPTEIISIPSGGTPQAMSGGGLSSVPEPASLTLFAVGTLAYLGTRLRRRLRTI